MQRTTLTLGPLETQVIAWAQLGKRSIVRSGEIVLNIGISAKKETEVLGRLCDSGLVVRLMKGLFLFPSQIPPGGKWGPSPDWVLAQFLDYIGVQYQITGLWAFHRYGYSEQVPNRISVYNTKFSGDRVIGNSGYTFIKVTPDRLGGTIAKVLNDGTKVLVSSPGRTLLDAIYEWRRFGTVPRVFDWIAARIEDEKLISEILKSTIEYGNTNTARRVGYLLSRLGVSKRTTHKLLAGIGKSSAFVPLVPTLPKRGSIDKTWGLVINTDWEPSI